jgi:hypothetical protein
MDNFPRRANIADKTNTKFHGYAGL